MKIPPYAAYTLPKLAGCKVGINTVEHQHSSAANTANQMLLHSRNQSQTR